MKKGLLGYTLKLAAASLIVWYLIVLVFADQFVFKGQETNAQADSSTQAFALENLEDGSFSGTAEGHNGPLNVEVVVEDGAVTAINLVDHVETAGISDPAIEQVPAAIIDAASTDVDIASGATVTSKAIIEAVQDALSE